MALLTVPRIITTHRAINRIRAEHDQWARNAKPGRYYTVTPTSLWVENIGPAVHSWFDFAKQGRGFQSGQMVTDRGRSSWSLWQEFGPFTAVRQFTSLDARAAEQRAMPGAMRTAQQAVTLASGWDTAWATAQRDYPETMRALQAA